MADYQSFGQASVRTSKTSPVILFAFASVVAFVVAVLTYGVHNIFWNIFPKIPSPDVVSQSSLRNFVAARVPTLAVRSGPVMYATSRSPFPSFGKRDVDADEQPAPKLPFFGAPPAQPAKPPKKPSTNSDALEVFHFFQQHKNVLIFLLFCRVLAKLQEWVPKL